MASASEASGPAAAPWTSDPPRWGFGDLLALLVWTGAVLAIFWDAATLRGAFFYFDVTELNYPYRDFLARELKAGRFSRWFPGLYCGMPLYSESQAGYLHPLKYLLYPWAETWKAFNYDNILSVWLTGLGTYGWLRRHVGPRGALAGAGVFGLSGFVWAHFIHTSMNNALTSVPFAVWALEWSWDRGRRAGVVLGALALAFQVFAGHLQDTLLTAGLLGVYALYRTATEKTARDRVEALGSAVGLVALGVALAAVQWIPSKELLDRSPRAGGLTWQALTYGSWHPELLPTLVVREAYGTRARDTDWMDGFYPYHEMNAYLGLTALALAVVGAGACRDRWVGFWVILTVLGGLLMLGKFTVIFDYAHRVPIAGSSRIPVRFHLWVSLAVAALAAVGVDRLGRGGPVRLRGALWMVGVLVAVSAVIMLYVYYPAMADPGRWNLTYHRARYRWLGRELLTSGLRTAFLTATALTAMVVATRSRSPRVRGLAVAVLPVVVIADLLGSHWYDAPTVSPTYWTDPPASAKALQADPKFVRLFGLARSSAGEPGYASEPVDFFAVRDTLDWSLPPVWGLKSANGQTPIIPRRLLAYTDTADYATGRFDVQAVTHIVTSVQAPRTLEPGETLGAAVVHPNSKALPRVRLVGRPYYAADQDSAVAALRQLGAAMRERVIVEDADRPLAPDAEAKGEVRVVRDDPERIEIEADVAAAGYLTLADTFDPGWSAAVDGRPAPIRPAWVAFRAVYLTPGRHNVAFTYRPAGFLTGLWVSLGGLTVAAALVPRVRRRSLRPAHDELHASPRWPLWLLLAAGLIVLASVPGFGSGGVGLQSRWGGSLHTFTWGAGLEAMRAGAGP